MVDLNTLIVPASTTYVTDAVLINDHGDIGCLGKDPGDTANHACLLIPCDENHPGIEGCDYRLADPSAAAEVHTAEIPKASAVAAGQPKLSPAEMRMRFRSLRAVGNRRFGTPQTSPQ